jgi:hypothetical protein
MRAVLVSFSLIHLLWGCADSSLEVRGALDRVVGETVTLNLVEGETGFSGELDLIAADETPFSSAALKVEQIDDSTISFVVPPGIAPGRAIVKAARVDESGTYDVPLTISRLAVALTSTGVVEVLPLPPTVLKTSTLEEIDATGGHLALTGSGGEVAVMAQDQINILPLGISSNNTFPGIQQNNGRAIAAIPGGVVICTDTAVFRFKHDQGQTTKTDILLPDCSAIAVSDDGTRAVVLSACDTDSDTVKEDCLTELKLASSITMGAQVSLDATPSASMVALRRDGMGAVVPDTKEIYGVWFDSAPVVTTVTWAPPATPAGISRGNSSLGDLFAIGDSSSGRIRFVAFDTKAGNTLKPVSDLDLKEIPTALGFGRRAELFVAAGTKLYQVNAQVQQPKAEALEVTASSEVSALLVQP